MSTSVTVARGKLYLVPAPLDFGCDVQAPLQHALPLGTLQAAAGITHWICENAKSARAYLKRIDAVVPLATTLQTQQIQELPREVHKKGDHAGQFDARPLLDAALQGHDIGLLSEAGMPAVADPGSSVARAAHDLGIEVVALTGPVSLLLALAASGLNGQNFAFVGYLPQDAEGRTQRIRELETLALRTGQTQLFIETPYRNAVLLHALTQTLQHHTRLAVARGLTLASASVRSDTVKGWRARALAVDERLPAVFAIGR
ncbi:SAM-dependent methyltransferase [Variovorax guangxiensis]|uniref:Ribosomal RNA small subunit methyltransferase I n=1 Tax=Variovorax guangxiensis TaxID=1775474 RepID=A0A502DNX0_9BURK|nr:SAM-dependent methyltransferase [Variovorax guangxiensis]RZI68521.1 MAG: ribosomal RNA small subunit methyltransferase I [Variovorax sp.]TPG22003.1 ribosomal RNA small subunit methyltransferase I [Variovorax ginsengisoli]TPG25891.1 ribosomal RNA small subunit methyltransferase I [Variovorax guangxiensis]